MEKETQRGTKAFAVCPYCNSNSTVKRGRRKRKFRIIQQYQCKSCKKFFLPKTQSSSQANKTYPIDIILKAVSTYNLGHTLKQTTEKINNKHQIKISISTLSSWLNEYRQICTFNRLRQQAVQLHNPREIIFSQRLDHNQIYNFKYHRAKLQLLFTNPKYSSFTSTARFQEKMQSYLESIPSKEFPHHLFCNLNKEENGKQSKNEQRASQLKFKHLKIVPLSKTNLANKLASLALNLAKTNKDRHQAIQNFMLINDSTTIAEEVPVYLTKNDIRYYAKVLNSTSARELLKHPAPITGHIDLLQFRNNLLYILDYKPEANKTNPIHQLTIYALALASRTRLNLKSMKCAWFDQNNYYEFYPLNAVYSMTESRNHLPSFRY